MAHARSQGIFSEELVELFRPPAYCALSKLRTRLDPLYRNDKFDDRDGRLLDRLWTLVDELAETTYFLMHDESTGAQPESVIDFWRTRFPWVPPADSSPVARLPDELLSYIFEISWLSEENNPTPVDAQTALVYISKMLSSDFSWLSELKRDMASEGRTSMLVTQVCCRWRRVAIQQTPLLWSCIHYCYLVTPFYVERYKEYLCRSHNHPLTIWIDIDPPDFNPLDGDELPAIVLEDINVLMSLLLPHSLRWRFFSLECYGWLVMQPVLEALASLSSGTCGLPKHLEVNINIVDFAHFAWVIGDPSGVGLASAKSLPEEPIHCDGISWLNFLTPCGTSIDFTGVGTYRSLTAMDLNSVVDSLFPSWPELGHVLCSAPQLEYLSITHIPAEAVNSNDWSIPVSQQDKNGRVPLKSLRRLRILRIPSGHLLTLLSCFHFPGLSSLCLDDDGTTLSQFIVCPWVPLQHVGELHISFSGMRGTIGDKIVERFLLRFSSLQKLHFGFGPSNEWLDAVCQPLRYSSLSLVEPKVPVYLSEAGILLPKLQLLEAYGTEFGPQIRRSLERRLALGFPVRKLITKAAHFENEDSTWLNGHIEVLDVNDWRRDQGGFLEKLDQRRPSLRY